MNKLLVIEGGSTAPRSFREAFVSPDVCLLTARSAGQGLELLRRERPDAILMDLDLPDLSGLETFRRIRQIDAKAQVIVVADQGTTDAAIETIRLGAYDYLDGPIPPDRLARLVAEALEAGRPEREQAMATGERPGEPAGELIGRCPQMQEVYKAIGRVAYQDLTVLITGESGTGKELVARAIHRHSRRAAGPFLAINCAAIPENLLESELFGHERGSFTGADRKRVGKFEQCAGGTLFLDEVGDMSPLTQTKVLRVLQDQRFERVGGNETVQANVRVVAATNRDLKSLAACGRFRDDLLYRLGVFSVELPPLRERAGDLPELISYFLARFCRELGKGLPKIAAETTEALGRYAWPGNLRELQSVLKQALLRSRGASLLPSDLPPQLRTDSRAAANGRVGPAEPDGAWDAFLRERVRDGSRDLYGESVEFVERLLIPLVLSQTGGNQSRAARILGITRGYLRSKIRSLGLVIEPVVRSRDERPEPEEDAILSIETASPPTKRAQILGKDDKTSSPDLASSEPWTLPRVIGSDSSISVSAKARAISTANRCG